jgi:hypothetical protein
MKIIFKEIYNDFNLFIELILKIKIFAILFLTLVNVQ